MIYSTALTSKINSGLIKHLIRPDGQEDLCFALWHPSNGKKRKSALIYKIIYPKQNERKVHGNVGFMPNFFERVVDLALKEKAGIAFLHSHPYPGWQNMSIPDKQAEHRMASSVYAVTGLPLVGLTVGNDEVWSARFWKKVSRNNYKKEWCSNVRVIGDNLIIHHNDNLAPPPKYKEELSRTFSAWGEKKQSDLMRLTIGVVGLGSVGSIVAESLARMGVAKIKLIDFDYIERKNLDRCLHATSEDIGKPKINVIAKNIGHSATADNFRVDAMPFSVVEENGFKNALDCDIIFSCVDRPWARQVLNLIAYAHLIPIIDGGISVGINKSGTDLFHANWKAHIASPGRRCLECLGQYNPSMANVEKEGLFEDTKYINSLDKDNSIRRNENVFAFSLSLASLEVMQMLSMVIYPCKITSQHSYQFVTGTLDLNNNLHCNDDCIFKDIVARGDNSGYTLTGKDLKASSLRQKYIKKSH